MPWNTIAPSDVLNDFTPAEQAALQNIQGATTNLGNTLTAVIAQVRGMIKAGGNQVDQTSATTVPDQLRHATIHIARWDWLTAFPGLRAMQSDARKEAAAAAEKRLSSIASQSPSRERIELPATADATPAAVPLPSTGCTKYNHFKRREEDGII